MKMLKTNNLDSHQRSIVSQDPFFIQGYTTNLFSSFCVTLQTNQPTNKYYYFGGGKKVEGRRDYVVFF